jgi:dihydroflavonol-4-reductase
VRALARTVSGTESLGRAGAEPVPGDVLDPPSLDRLMAGASWVFHVAGVNQLCPRDPDGMWRVNVEGTRNVVEACRRSGVLRLIHTSSAITIGEEDGAVGTEETPRRGHYLSHYERTKTEAEVVALAGTGEVEVVVVNPSSVQGPGRATGTGRLFLLAVRGKLPFAIDTTFSLVDIDDCARGHLLAAERGRVGERYLLSGATLTTPEAMSMLAAVTGARPRVRYLRPGLLSALASVVGSACAVAGRQAPICSEAVRVLRHGHRYDGSRATRELGLAYTPVEETLRRTVDWFRSEAMLG